jgi:hypothetical protein
MAGLFLWTFDMKQESGFALPSQTRLSAPSVPIGVASVTFRDRAFKSRTLVFSDGSTLSVEMSAVTASDAEQIVALDCHPDFERSAEGV